MPADNPTHPAASLHDALEETGWNVNEFAANLGISRNTASRLLNERSGITAAVAMALEGIGWGTADFWMRRQANYDLAQGAARCGRRGEGLRGFWGRVYGGGWSGRPWEWRRGRCGSL